MQRNKIRKNSACKLPTFENYAAPNARISINETLKLSCKPGYFVYTEDIERKCMNITLESDFKTSPAECLTNF